MNRKLLIPFLILTVTLCGCGRTNYPALPDDPIAFEMGTIEDTEHDSARFGTLEYNGRTYIGYGTIRNTFKPNDVDQCLGYIVMDESSTSNPDPDNTNVRVYTLREDPDHNFLMDYDTAGFMNQPSLWRAIDTKGMDIKIPQYINALEYDFWK